MEPNKTKKENDPGGDPVTVVPDNQKGQPEESGIGNDEKFPEEKTEKEPYVDFSKLF